MREIYVNSSDRKVYLTAPASANPGTLDVNIYSDGVLLTSVSSASFDGSKYSIDLPLRYSSYDRELEVEWNFEYDEDGGTYDFTTTTPVSVVTPILPLEDVKSILGPFGDDTKVVLVESAVRHIIQSHTGQSFGYYKDKAIEVEGHGENALKLPMRLIKLTGVNTLNAILDPNNSITTADGWYLKKGWTGDVTYVENDSTYWGGSEVSNVAPGEPGYEKPSHGPVIYAPGYGPQPTTWRDDYPFTIKGDWGYKTVPNNVQEAARLLVNDYGCNESLYRDRYLESISAADWKLSFSSGAWAHTGNVRADQLLSEYIILDWAAI